MVCVGVKFYPNQPTQNDDALLEKRQLLRSSIHDSGYTVLIVVSVREELASYRLFLASTGLGGKSNQFPREKQIAGHVGGHFPEIRDELDYFFSS